MSNKPYKYDCFEGSKYVCTGIPKELADQLGLKLVTVKSYISGKGGHRYQMYRIPPRPRDYEEARWNRVNLDEINKVRNL